MDGGIAAGRNNWKEAIRGIVGGRRDPREAPTLSLESSFPNREAVRAKRKKY